MYSHNEEELIALGEAIGRQLQAGDVLVLSGDLGAGKTTLTKGIARGLEIEQMIKSPTYTIVREYEGRLPLYHLDVYRIGDDPDSIDLDDFLYGDGVTVIEWGELLAASLLDDVLRIVIEKVGDGRRLSLEPQGKRSQALLEEIEYGAG
ncbi:tRNA (adenosine(37)-N6)-threonylcarbamoyltransferase complex ATPase subunit type 1 TsaE [Streptococcus acidominimus]|nr:tRNA (adenosine(37)-N6)-threonylcarbamoyltransferase complex ATPase subunit type 1 TsaE [Streptococcus acidominimus]MBF0819068.1 tRNA (adenosine(37)-N6)-threonylcarbamoyltransferase complex ATPase subunit type 1 TsaE [Streptococcus acidominimus]MBF0839880.1 tRNA (adenosine(37)-N6)-threonylcarbamoyltransferase complex ATPase subunit type 1 TsaE [Streptococcus acidominimus]MBF0845969.1 tRNA (adenosine(37)-N6)-threonylcarbamoyltransferase complex ATPase subunit type 1 TsaE [Streptococcus danieli